LIPKAILAASALLATGCLESKPSPVDPYVPEVGGPPPVADAGTDAVVSDEAFDPDAAAVWSGTWQFVSGSQGLNCSGTISVSGSEGFLSITPEATGAGMTVVEDGCSFRFVLAGDTATETPAGQACAKWAIPVIPEWTLTLQADGTLEEHLGGQVSVNCEPCLISGKSILRRQ